MEKRGLMDHITYLSNNCLKKQLSRVIYRQDVIIIRAITKFPKRSEAIVVIGTTHILNSTHEKDLKLDYFQFSKVMISSSIPYPIYQFMRHYTKNRSICYLWVGI